MLRFFSPSYISAGFVAVLVGYAGAGAIVFQAANAAGATPDQISSWLWAVGIGMGVSSIGLTLFYRQPILIAWSTPGAALLATSLPGVPMGDAIGAFIFSSLLLTLCGVTGLFQKIMAFVPQSLASALLAAVLLRFGLDAFVALEADVVMVGAMVAVFLAAKQFMPRYVIPLTLLTGVVIALIGGQISSIDTDFTLTRPVFVMPSFDLPTLIGVGIPLFIVTMASQNVPGIAALRAHGYDAPASPLIGWSGFTGVVLAPFGGYAFNLAAITAALCMSPDVHPDPAKRYPAVLWASVFYCLAGLFGAAITALFIAFPAALVMAIAGLALLSTIANSLEAALKEETERDAAILTFAVTASGLTLLSIGAPFWGIVIGMGAYLFRKHFTRIKKG
ncbi:benzoate/H(+) symporter BenE family transporter [Sneathiella chungangensis]|uniref:Benzoate/H(+) symporter BenE family transporter n=1 Tax=Sneathiella chungangensis TaxID=1418234 RepID=A0A845MI89_9PROT|nr:benzoate/H(+) symporter BenE family transporter [Sneathiella chungangensis]MZR23375.1 benzoate/H(+) symporter BenE family transporter [Sneathiella chungangensis]